MVIVLFCELLQNPKCNRKILLTCNSAIDAGNGSVAQEDKVSSEESLEVADNPSKKKSRKVSSKNCDQSDVASEVPSTQQTKKRVAKGHSKDTSVDIIVKQAEITQELSVESNDMKGNLVFFILSGTSWLCCDSKLNAE